MTVNILTCWKCLGICEPIESNGVGLHECQNCGIVFETSHYQKLWQKHVVDKQIIEEKALTSNNKKYIL